MASFPCLQSIKIKHSKVLVSGADNRQISQSTRAWRFKCQPSNPPSPVFYNFQTLGVLIITNSHSCPKLLPIKPQSGHLNVILKNNEHVPQLSTRKLHFSIAIPQVADTATRWLYYSPPTRCPSMQHIAPRSSAPSQRWWARARGTLVAAQSRS